MANVIETIDRIWHPILADQPPERTNINEKTQSTRVSRRETLNNCKSFGLNANQEYIVEYSFALSSGA
jgi:hypothetical protein